MRAYGITVLSSKGLANKYVREQTRHRTDKALGGYQRSTQVTNRNIQDALVGNHVPLPNAKPAPQAKLPPTLTANEEIPTNDRPNHTREEVHLVERNEKRKLEEKNRILEEELGRAADHVQLVLSETEEAENDNKWLKQDMLQLENAKKEVDWTNMELYRGCTKVYQEKTAITLENQQLTRELRTSQQENERLSRELQATRQKIQMYRHPNPLFQQQYQQPGQLLMFQPQYHQQDNIASFLEDTRGVDSRSFQQTHR
jgi:hypothetical protein